MKKTIICLLTIANLSFADKTGSGIDGFSSLPQNEQDKIIQKDFIILDEMMSELRSINTDINKTKLEIVALKKKNNPKVCQMAFLLKGDISELTQQLSKIHNKKSTEYENVYKKYIETKNFHSSIICKEKQ